MARRGVIQDSDDEGEDFSPLKSDRASPIYAAEVTVEVDATANVARSTDSEFFQDVYEAQQGDALQNVTNHASTGDTAPFDSTKDFSLQPGPPADLLKMNNSSSITDPTVASRRKKVTNSKDFESITQVTTPGKMSSASVDPYAIPSSPPEVRHDSSTKAKTTKTSGKRKRTPKVTPAKLDLQHVTEDRHRTEMYEPPDLSPLPAKRRRASGDSRNLDHLAEDVDLVTIPRTEEAFTSAVAGLRDEQVSSSVVYDTMKIVSGTTTEHSAASFYIAQGQLSASQKLQYQPINCSSEQGSEGNGAALPTKSFTSQTEQRSSGDATIAYTTPSRFGSSNGRRAPAVQQSREPGSSASISLSTKEQKLAEPGYEPTSSPDILTEFSAGHRPAEADQEVASQDGKTQESGLSSGVRTRKKKQQTPVEEPWDPEEAELPQERYVPRPSRRRSTATVLPDTQPHDESNEPRENAQKGPYIGSGSDNLPILISSGQEATTEQVTPPGPLQTKKRGRKKKLISIENDETTTRQLELSDIPEPSCQAQTSTTETTAPVKRKKRGRPRKGESQPLSVAEVDGAGAEETGVVETLEEAVEKSDGFTDQPDAKNARDKDASSLAQQSLQETQEKPKGRGRKKKANARSLSNEPEPTASQEKAVLKDISNVGVTQKSPSGNEGGKVADGKATQEPGTIKKETAMQDSKTGVSNSQTAKVAYRVGLSKRSRIAPLLKSLRK